MHNAESHTHILFFVQLKAHSPYQLVPKPRRRPPHPQLYRAAKFLAGGNPRQPLFSTCGTTALPHQQGIGHSTLVRQKPGRPSRQLKGPRQSVGVHHPNSRAHTKVWESMVDMSKKKCEKGWKWVRMGENPKIPYPPCGRSMKTYARGNNDAPSITKYGSPVRIDAQIVALR